VGFNDFTKVVNSGKRLQGGFGWSSSKSASFVSGGLSVDKETTRMYPIDVVILRPGIAIDVRRAQWGHGKVEIGEIIASSTSLETTKYVPRLSLFPGAEENRKIIAIQNCGTDTVILEAPAVAVCFPDGRYAYPEDLKRIPAGMTALLDVSKIQRVDQGFKIHFAGGKRLRIHGGLAGIAASPFFYVPFGIVVALFAWWVRSARKRIPKN
jgi:hypothetical protein